MQEGGRTNRGLANAIETLLVLLKELKLEKLSQSERNILLAATQGFLAEKVGEYFSRDRVKFSFSPENSAWQTVHDFLSNAREVGKEGQIAQYLVGAKLSVRFPSILIRNDTYSTSDVQSGSPGDFLVNDTAFHVTVAPNLGHFEKCKTNINSGYTIYLLVPERMVVGSRQNAENIAPNKITVQSIESFVSQNVENHQEITKKSLVVGFKKLLDCYNERVNQIERDKSMLIEIPPN